MSHGSRLMLLAALGAALPPGLAAQEVRLDGFVDGRLVRTANERGWMEGGLGKLRYDGGGDIGPRLAEVSAIGSLRLTPDIGGVAHVRYEPEQRHPLDLIEAYVHYRPVSTTPFRWSIKGGAFFPPVSLENEGIGWTTIWTLTPSAINSWVGDELRTIGGEALLEWRDAVNHFELTGAVYVANDPAGVLLADRGWTLSDRPTGLFDRARRPDAVTPTLRRQPPVYSEQFLEIDDRVGWYFGGTWRSAEYGRLSLLYYNNQADPAARSTQFAWETEFWSLGAETRLGDFVVIGQAMTGQTTIQPTVSSNRTRFKSAFLLLGYEFGDWRLGVRGEQFGTSTQAPATAAPIDERGYAGTLAVTWRPTDWLRLTGEAIFITSTRSQRRFYGQSPEADDTLLQLSARVFF